MSAGDLSKQPILPFENSIFQRGLESFKEVASSTFKKGAPVILDSDGYLAIYAGGGTVFGIAAEDAHNGGSSGLYECLVHRLKPGERWLITYQDALDQTNIGEAYGLITDPGGSGNWCIDEADNTNEVTVVGYPQGPGQTAIGDTLKYVFAVFTEDKIQGA